MRFADYLPEEIECLDIGFVTLESSVLSHRPNNSLPPYQPNILDNKNNILPNWYYCLAAFYNGNWSRQDSRFRNCEFRRPFYMVMTVSTYDKGKGSTVDNRIQKGMIINPIPKDLNDLWFVPEPNLCGRFQKDIGLFFCKYYTKVGDIFPLADSLYCINRPFHAKKLSKDELEKIGIKRNTGTLAIPFSGEDHEDASDASLSYLPKLNFCVTRIYAKPYNNDKGRINVARICTVNSSNIEFIYHSEHKLPSIGDPYLKRPIGQYYPTLETKTMQVQELTEGEIIKGEGLGYRITSIVLPDVEGKHQLGWLPMGVKGALIGWVEIDPTPIPLDENIEQIKER